ncbi:MAG: metallophosphoesterase [Deltaproteobacteria bacterium]|nr:metallophosphoesterase [Deltaproteobacteria bacterium]
MIKLVHISDLHFHQDRKDNTAIHNMLLGVMNEYFLSGTNYLLVTGDIVDDGDRTQYALAFEALNPFGRRVLVCPGNHDYGPFGVMYSESSAHYFDTMLAGPLGYRHPYCSKVPMVRILQDGQGSKLMTIGVNAVLETSSPFDFSCGEIGESQLEQLSTVLSSPEYATVPKLVYLHFHPFMRDNFTMKLRDSEAFMTLLDGRVQVLCFGHEHVRELWKDKAGTGIQWILASGKSPEADHVFEIAVEGSQVTVNDSVVASIP